MMGGEWQIPEEKGGDEEYREQQRIASTSIKSLRVEDKQHHQQERPTASVVNFGGGVDDNRHDLSLSLLASYRASAMCP
jgi:hypothetical protein